MCDEKSGCLTRVTDDQCAMHVTCVQDVMQKIQASLHCIPQTHHHYIANALLNMAVTRMMHQNGSAQTSSILMRLGGVVATQSNAPQPERAIDLTALNS